MQHVFHTISSPKNRFNVPHSYLPHCINSHRRIMYSVSLKQCLLTNVILTKTLTSPLIASTLTTKKITPN